MKSYGPISTPYSDCPVPKPSPGSAAGNSFGSALSGQGPSKADGKLEEVQMSDIGPRPGSKVGK